jgi:hypothetical protein
VRQSHSLTVIALFSSSLRESETTAAIPHLSFRACLGIPSLRFFADENKKTVKMVPGTKITVFYLLKAFDSKMTGIHLLFFYGYHVKKISKPRKII